MSIPLSTYRLQLNANFPFGKTTEIVDYLKRLGIGAAYLSPILLAKPGSTHGYDICDHSRINPELGGDLEFDRLSEALQNAGLGCVVDFVPNHMAADPASNHWWWDVLENGPSSPYSPYFDVDWFPIKPELRGKVLLPVLGDQYGIVLERGELKIGIENGALILNYFDKKFPLNPRMAGMVLQPAEGDSLPFTDPEFAGEFLSILTSLRNLPAYLETDSAKTLERQREKEIARKRLVQLLVSSPEVNDYVKQCIAAINGVAGVPASFDRLHALLENQTYRLAYWRTAGQEVNYRRFFDINDLLGVRMENPEVVNATHAFLMSQVAEGRITGIRLDHIDGLYDPEQYLVRLSKMLKEATLVCGNPSAPIYVVVEKILCGEEVLPTSWPVHGTTGYEFLNEVNGLFVDPAGIKSLLKVHSLYTKKMRSYADEIHKCKRLILDTSMSSELNVLANILNRMSEADRKCRDFTLENLRNVIREVIVCLPIYRTYVRPEEQSSIDRMAILQALEIADHLNPAIEASIFQFLKVVLLPFEPCDLNTPGASLSIQERIDFTMRFQQLSGPIQAKGVEDTAFYRHCILLSLNDVGGEPGSSGVSSEKFHSRIQQRMTHFPNSMLTTSTHDTKRGEDSRARLSVLSWYVAAWRHTVSKVSKVAKGLRIESRSGTIPSRADEYFIYQALLGSWPIAANGSALPADKAFVERLHDFLIKAVREAKVRTSWINSDEEYESGLCRFIDSLLLGKSRSSFKKAFFPLVDLIAKQGALNSLAQLAIKCACPGVPDIYQGTEHWDLSLVDPDNRRPVDYRSRDTSLCDMESYIHPETWPENRKEWMDKLLLDWPSGKIKQYVMARSLRWRSAFPDLFIEGDYKPLTSIGNENSVLCFSRHKGTQRLIVCAQTKMRATQGPIYVRIPQDWNMTSAVDIYTGQTIPVGINENERCLELSASFQEFPVMWLWTIADESPEAKSS